MIKNTDEWSTQPSIPPG